MTSTSIPLEFVEDTDPHYIGFLYGRYGHWKTTTACHCINAVSDVATGLHIGTDRGVKSIKKFPDIDSRIKKVQYLGLSQIDQIGREDYKEVDLVILDTITGTQAKYIDWLDENVTWQGAFREKTVPKRGSKASPEEIPGMPDYHLARNKIRKPLRKLFEAPVDVIILAQLREPSFIEQQKGKITKRPEITQRLYDYIAEEADFVGFMEKKPGKVATIDFRSSPKIEAKSRIDPLYEQVIDAPNLPEILKKWKEEVSG